MSNNNQFRIHPLTAAVTAALGTGTAATALAQEGGDDALEEVIVTATKVEQNLQDIPSSVQAISESMLKAIGAMNTEDYVRFLPSVSWINFNSGGSNYVIFRGINTTSSGYTGPQSSSIYLDEITLTATDGTQPDIRMMDISRTEALNGPQGTLFGAAAQAGTLRIITNKPDPSKFEGSADIVYSGGQTSDRSHSVTGMFNLPLVEDVFAIRVAAQSATDGGYIDNISGHSPDTHAGEIRSDSNWAANRQGWGDMRNDNVVEKNWNSAEHTAIRVQALWNINDNWTATLAYHYGDTDSQGASSYKPFVGDLKTIRFVKNTSRSEWDMASLTVEGDLGFAQFVSATSFYENQRTYTQDNTMYYKYYTTKYCDDKGEHIPGYYWQWNNTTTGRAIYAPLYCVGPVAGDPLLGPTQLADIAGVGEGPEFQERFAQEIRLSHQGEKFDWLAGLYYEDSNDSWNSVWMKDANTPFQESISYQFMLDCATGLNPDTSANWQCASENWGVLASAPAEDLLTALETADHYWDSRDDTDWETKAIFGELTWHVTDDLNVTAGGRWFETKNDKLYVKYNAGHKAGNDRNEGGIIQYKWRGNDIVQSEELSEFVPKLSISYNLDDDKMVYGLYTEGYRTGGINRANKNADWSRTLWGQAWDPDKLKNYEVGLRSRWAEGTVQMNVTGFYMDWEEMQHEVVDPSSGDCVIPAEEPTCDSGQLPWISIVGNVGDAHSTGIEAELDWVPSDRWQVGANAIWLQAEIDGTSSDERSGIVKGQELPNFPEFQGAMWATYTWPAQFLPGAEMFIRAQSSFSGKTRSRLVPSSSIYNPSFTNDSYTITSLRAGLVAADGNWQIDLFVNNIADERAQVQQGNSTGEYAWGRSGEYEHSHNVWTVRPREYGIRFTTRWGN